MSRLPALVLLVVVLCVPLVAPAQQLPCGQNSLVAFNKETLTVSTTAISLTQAKYAPTTGVNNGSVAIAALVSVQTASITVLDDGTVPTKTDGAVFTANAAFWLCRVSIARAQMIRTGSSDASIQVIYYRSQ